MGKKELPRAECPFLSSPALPLFPSLTHTLSHTTAVQSNQKGTGLVGPSAGPAIPTPCVTGDRVNHRRRPRFHAGSVRIINLGKSLLLLTLIRKQFKSSLL